MDTLKPCPWCNGIKLNYTYDRLPMLIPSGIICESCGARGPTLNNINTKDRTTQKLRELWDQRN